MVCKMGNYSISCCASADLNREFLEEIDVRYIYFHFDLGGKHYYDDMWQSMKPQEMYGRMLDGEDCRTSQINATEYEEFFEEVLKEGKDVIHICLAGGLSGTVNSARIAANELEERYPDNKIYIVDSVSASSGFGLLVAKAAELRDAGMGAEELYNWLEEHKYKLQNWFISTDLTFLIKGGRVTKTAGFVGSALKICPLLHIDKDGKLIPMEKIRTTKKCIKRIIEIMKERAEGGEDYSDLCYISQAESEELAQYTIEQIKQAFPKCEPKMFTIGATIGVHTGPGTLAVFFFGNDRREE